MDEFHCKKCRDYIGSMVHIGLYSSSPERDDSSRRHHHNELYRPHHGYLSVVRKSIWERKLVEMVHPDQLTFFYRFSFVRGAVSG